MPGTISALVWFAIIALVSAENCVVNPSCTCPGSRVDCTLRHGYDLPKFANTTKFIYYVYITGNRNIRRTPEGAFNGLTIYRLSITGTGVSFLDCTVFKGINETLRDLYLDDNLLSSVPSCSFQNVRNITYLYMRNNRLVAIQPRAFDKLFKLDTLRLDNNNITGISQEAFTGLGKLEYLTISRNQLSVLEGTSFQELGNLWLLGLSHNEISRVHPKAFDGLGNLRNLDLSYNSISTLDHTVFQNMFKLRSLNIGHNHISEIHYKIFEGLIKLYHVNLGSNNLKTIPDELFASNPDIRTLNLSGQKLSSLSKHVLQTITNIELLDLRGNQITELQPRQFNNLSRLRTIDLSDNGIQHVNNDSFLNLRSLGHLDLSRNLITELKASYFTNSSSYTVKLQHNKITWIEIGTFSGLKILNLSSNGLSEDSWTWLNPLLSHVESFDLSNNPLGDINSKYTPIFDSSSTLVLRNCSLTVVPNFPIDSRFHRILDISHNQIWNDVSINFKGTYSGFLEINLENNQISSPIKGVVNNNRGLYIDRLVLSQNYFTQLDRFPVFDKTNDHILCDDSIDIKNLDLSRNNISSISPDACLGKVRVLDLSNNQLSVLSQLLPRNQSSDKYRVRYLYLTGNKIHQIEQSVFAIGISLLTIKLSDNKLRDLAIFRNVLNGTNLRSLTLTNNPLHCDCQLAWFRNSTIISKINGARCASPPKTRGYLLECFSLDQCSPEQRLFSRYTPLDICESDVNVKVTNLTVVTNQNQLNVKWSRFGPGEITGFKMEYGKDNEISAFQQELIHPRKYETTLDDVSDGAAYNICVSAELNSIAVSNMVCVTTDVTSSSEQTQDIMVIALGIALGVSLLCLFAVCAVCLVQRHRHKSSNVDNTVADKTLPLTSVTQPTSKAEGKSSSTSAPEINNGYEENMYEDMRDEICGENYEEPVRYTVQK